MMGVSFLEDRWLPKSVLCLRDYNRHKFFLNLIAGVSHGNARTLQRDGYPSEPDDS